MKKLVMTAIITALSAPVLADIGLDVALGYETTSTQPPALAVMEYVGTSNPDGVAANITWEVIGTGGMYLGLDYSDTEDDYELFGSVDYTVTKDRAAFNAGYTFSLDDTTRLTAGLNYAVINWDLAVDNGSSTDIEVKLDGDGVSLILGAEKSVTDSVALGTSFSAGFETGAEVYAVYHVIAGLNFKASYNHNRYDLDEIKVYDSGSLDVKDKFDTEFSDQIMQLSAIYSF